MSQSGDVHQMINLMISCIIMETCSIIILSDCNYIFDTEAPNLVLFCLFPNMPQNRSLGALKALTWGLLDFMLCIVGTKGIIDEKGTGKVCPKDKPLRSPPCPSDILFTVPLVLNSSIRLCDPYKGDNQIPLVFLKVPRAQQELL